MDAHRSRDFVQAEKEVTEALGVLKRHGLNVTLPESVMNNISASILFDGDDALFKDLIKDTKVYFEYGCGKSTEFVFRHTDANIRAVDTSQQWVHKTQSLTKKGGADRLTITWIDVGEVGDWGRPISFSRRQNFKKYADHFWSEHREPDLVLIDGRFRVLCFLTAIKYAPLGTKILFDDYVNRPHYHVAEEYSRCLDVCGRQALFEVTAEAKEQMDEKLLLSFQNVIL